LAIKTNFAFLGGTMTNSQIAEWVVSRVGLGETQSQALEAIGCTYSRWTRIRDKAGIDLKLRKGKPAKIYTPERVRQVMARIKGGEFLCDICTDMGMDSRNLARYCRRNGIKLFTAEDLKKNYMRRVGIGRTRKRLKPDPAVEAPQAVGGKRGRPDAGEKSAKAKKSAVSLPKVKKAGRSGKKGGTGSSTR
jgi:hypothetical protein